MKFFASFFICSICSTKNQDINSYEISSSDLFSNAFEPAFTMQTSNFNDLEDHAQDCKMAIDDTVLLSCADGASWVD
jgi:hypothetical protein